MNKEIKVTKEELLDPLITPKMFTSVLYEGDLKKIALLIENPRFVEYNKDLLLACGKDFVPYYKNPYNQVALLFILLGINILLDLFNSKVNVLVFGIILFIFIRRLPKFNSWSDDQEAERVKYIDNLLKGSRYEKSVVGLE